MELGMGYGACAPVILGVLPDLTVLVFGVLYGLLPVVMAAR